MRVALGLVVHRDRVLLHRRDARHIAEYDGGWELPGGRIEPGESPEQAAVREAREETGQQIRVEGLMPFTYHPPDAVTRRHGGRPIEVLCAIGHPVHDPREASTPGPARSPAARWPAARWIAVDQLPWQEIIPGSREFLIEALTSLGHVPNTEPYRMDWQTPDGQPRRLALTFRPGQSRRYAIAETTADTMLETDHHETARAAYAALQKRATAALRLEGAQLLAVDPRHPLRTWLMDLTRREDRR